MLIPALLAIAFFGQAAPRTLRPGDVLDIRVVRLDASAASELIVMGRVPEPGGHLPMLHEDAFDAIWAAGAAPGTTFFPPCRLVVPSDGDATVSTSAIVAEDRRDGEPPRPREEVLTFQVTTIRRSRRTGGAAFEIGIGLRREPDASDSDQPPSEHGQIAERGPTLQSLKAEGTMIWTPFCASRWTLYSHRTAAKPNASVFVEAIGSRPRDVETCYVAGSPLPVSPEGFAGRSLDIAERVVEITGPMHVIFVTRAAN